MSEIVEEYDDDIRPCRRVELFDLFQIGSFQFDVLLIVDLSIEENPTTEEQNGDCDENYRHEEQTLQNDAGDTANPHRLFGQRWCGLYFHSLRSIDANRSILTDGSKKSTGRWALAPCLTNGLAPLLLSVFLGAN